MERVCKLLFYDSSVTNFCFTPLQLRKTIIAEELELSIFFLWLDFHDREHAFKENNLKPKRGRAVEIGCFIHPTIGQG
jgi:hypothetical protein